MKAVRIHEHGGPEVLRLEEVPTPQPGPHQVLVRVRAVALNHIDLWLRRGLPRLRLEFPHILGADIAGEVAALGPGVTGWREGDPVLLHPGVSCGHCQACLAGLDNRCPEFSILGEHMPGGYAQYITVPEQNLLPKPAHLSFEEAAAMPLVFLTAWNMLVTNARLRFGEEVLIWGAGSGVGSAGIQIARLFEARVITTAGAAWKLERAREIGADVGINYREQDVLQEVRRLTGRRGVDVVLDHVGAATWETSIKALAPGGRLAVCGATSGPQTPVDIRYIYARQLTITGTWVGTQAEMREVLRLIQRRRFVPVVFTVLPLEEAAEAHRIMEESRHFGKIVLQVS
ncbi:MAG: zinc-binding dehydrogenase [Armatimonadota bacterium]|nr:zinc-binding dehydrogenase [Armatimonadota bacterium]MDR7540276.1 zinc-binding dehydrogenase [Armatimonadota bacterium]